jgi:hypothetical protein
MQRPAPVYTQRQRWVCLTCRKMFRPYLAHGPEAQRLAERVTACPQCRLPMRAVGRYFQPPRREAVAQWRKVAALLDAGVTFDGYQPRPPKRPSEVKA